MNRLRPCGRLGVFAVLILATRAAAVTLPSGFQETIALSGLTAPTAVRFASDGRVFVAEKSGIIKVFPSLGSTTPTVFADLRTNVHNYWDRGLLGLALHPNFPTTPYVYVLYTLDAEIGGTPPRWGSFGGTVDDCPTPPGPTTDGCVVAARLSRLTALGNLMTGTEQVLLENWCQQFPSHSIGAITFGADGALYLSAGEGANFNNIDYGQFGIPKNPCGDPPAGPGGTQTPPSARGGAVRSQNLGLAGYGRVTYGGKVLRLDPITGAALPDNPLAGSPIDGQDRIVAFGLRNPFRLTVRPGTDELWIGDVGWSTWEEINRVSNPTGGVANFGWPCYEGPALQGTYQSFSLTSCSLLYNNPGSVLGPVFAWNHGGHVGTGDNCGTGGSAISGLAFYNGGSYPANYNGALFFSDYSRDCIWTMFPGAFGDPDPSLRASFAEGASGPVDLQIGPGGDLFYVDMNGGKIRRIQSFSTNQAPIALIDSDVTGGPLPLVIQFDGTGSYDPESGPVTYSWDLNGDGVFGDSTAAAPAFTYTSAASLVVGLAVTDQLGATGEAFLEVTPGRLPPAVTILTPTDNTTWSVGTVIGFSGSAVDPQDGILAPSRLSWSLIMHHCPSDCHTHPVRSWFGVASGSFAAPDHSYSSYLELVLTATNSLGLSASTSVILLPNTVDLTFQTNPPGLLLSVGALVGATPFGTTAIVGSQNSLSAPQVQGLGPLQYYFASWSDGGAPSHEVVAGAGPTTYVATYGTVPPITYGAANAYATGSETHGVATGDFNGDGRIDIVAANHLSSNVSVLRGNGDGTFQAAVNYAVGIGPKSVAVGDFNKDGQSDLVTGNQEGDSVSVLLGNGNGTFQPRVDYPTCLRAHEVAIADLNGDGRQDLGVACWGGSVISVLLGNANGTFQAAVNYAAGSAPHSIVARDFGGDGLIDLAVANHTGSNLSVLRGNGNGTFQAPVNYAVGEGPHSLRAADLDFDGSFDLAVVTDGSDEASILLNNGDGTFAPPVSYPTGSVPKGVGLGDVNGDGIPDLIATNTAGNYPVCCNPGGDKLNVFLGNGDGTFGPPVTYTVGLTPFSVAIADLNSDSLQDLVTANWHSNNVTVLLNLNLGGLTTTTTLVPTTTTTTAIALTTTTSTTSTTSTTIPLPSPWLHQDVGSVGLAGTAGFSGTTFAISASGADIWDVADGFHFVYQPWTGDVDIVARAVTVPNTDGWAKAGVMIRESLTAGSRHAMMVATPGAGTAFQRRTSPGGASTHTAGPAVTVPYWVRLVRSGNAFSAYASANGTSWTLVGSETITMASSVFVGMPVTSHNNSVRGFASLDGVSVTAPAVNVPPTVTLTSPTNGATYTAPATVALAATASDSDGTVTRVDFYAGAAPIGSDTTAPFAVTWNNVQPGNYTLTAVATDNGGLPTTSTPISISVSGGGGTLPLPWAQADVGSVAYAGTGSFAAGTFSLTGSGVDIWDPVDSFYFVYQPLTGNGEIIARVASLQNTNPWAKAGVMIRETLSAGSRHAMVVVTPGNGVAWQRRTATGGFSTHTAGPAVTAPYWVRLVRSGNTFTAYASGNGTTWSTIGSDTIVMAANVYVGLPVTSHDNTVVAAATVDGVSVSGGVPPTTTTTVPPPTTTSTSTSSTTTSTVPATTTSTTVPTTTSTSTSSTTTSTVPTTTTSTTVPTTTSTSTSSTTTSTVPATTTSTTVPTTSTTTSSTTTSTVPTTTTSTTVPTTSTSTSSTVTTSTTIVTTSSTTTTSSSTTTSLPVTTSTSSTTSTTVPSVWTNQDIGAVGVAGSATVVNDTASVTGSGADIWGVVDAFQFVYQPLTGDGQIVARVASVQNTNAWAKAGVMVRASLAPGAAHTLMAVTPGNGVAYHRRITTGGATTHIPGPLSPAPYWVRLVRAGNVVTGYASADGSTWTPIGTGTLPLGTTAYVGLAVTSHNNGVLCSATFDNVALSSSGLSLPPPWLEADVGAVGAPGVGTYSSGTFTVTASGSDIWFSADQFHFVYRPLAGDGQITALVTSVPTTDPWAKAGVMIRETLAPGSAHGMMIVSRSAGAAFQWRPSTGAATNHLAGPVVTAPYWVRLVRSGSLVSAYASANGTAWTLVGSSTIPMAANVYVGLPVTSHNNQLIGTATLDNVQ